MMNKIKPEEYLPKYVEIINDAGHIRTSFKDLNEFMADPDKFVTKLLNSSISYLEYAGITNPEIKKDMENIKKGLTGEFTRNQAIMLGRNRLFNILNNILNHISNSYSSVKNNIVGPFLINQDNLKVIADSDMFVNNFLDRKDNYTANDAYKEHFINSTIDIMLSSDEVKLKDPLVFLVALDTKLKSLLENIEKSISTSKTEIQNFLNYYTDNQKLIPAILEDKDVNKTYKRFEEPKYTDLPFTNIVSDLSVDRNGDLLDGTNIITTLDSIYTSLVTYLNKIQELNKNITDTILEFPSKTYDIEAIINSTRNIATELKDGKSSVEEANAMFIKNEITLLNTVTLDQHLLVIGLAHGNLVNHHLNNYYNIYNIINKLTSKAVLKPVTVNE